jgi:tetratricopeptide (TPR) repeat protein/tRNA A-37 threonylcarbamoyl transferase component Bud32
MTGERWRQIESLFLQALECPPEARSSFLDRVCDGNEALRREVDSLLAFDAPEQRLIEVPDLPDGAGVDDSDSEMSGRRIGQYRIERAIGQGGMGTVYLGVRDDDQYHKQVAIKLLKRGMDTHFMLSRFRQERQILADLEHPFIARMFDGGATEDGLPYFVMEYVDGVPITTYCAEKNLTVPERLRLFRLVCEAVQHAHQNLVVHRDIKPSNILTTREGVPKLLDFGIAKVVNPELTSNETLTRRDLRMLTPEYASPEQVKGLPISTAHDIYSLGVVLYQLLSRQRPYKFPSGAFFDMEKIICDIEPEKPSLAAARNTAIPAGERKQLRRQISGDLDAIVLKAMRKDPQRRYASAAEFSEDLRRHMEGLPTVAQGSRWTYAAGKFIRRNRLIVVAAMLVLASLIGGIVTTTFQARRAERRFQMVRGLASSMLFELNDEIERLPGSTGVRASMIRTVVKYLDNLARDGATDPGLQLEIALAYERAASLEGHPFRSNLGRGSAALANYLKAIALFDRLAEHPDFRSQALRGLIDTHLEAGEMESLFGNPAAAAAHSRLASEIAKKALAPGSPQIPPGTRMNLYFRLGDAAYQRGSAGEELDFYTKALEVSQKSLASEKDAESLALLRDAYQKIAGAQARGGDLFGARESYARALKTTDELLMRTDARQEQRYNVVSVHISFGDVLAAPDDPNFGDRSGALDHYHAALTIALELAASDSRNVNARRNVAASYRRLGMMWMDEKPEQALDWYQKSLLISQDLSSADPLNAEYRYGLSRGYMGVGEAFHHLGKNEDSLRNLTRAIDLQNAIANVSPERIWNLRILSRCYTLIADTFLGLGDSERAWKALNDGLAIAERILQRAPNSMYHQLDRADVLEAMGRYYLALAARPNTPAARRPELRQEARLCYQKSLAVWQSWSRRKLATPYAGRRESRVAAIVASLRQP